MASIDDWQATVFEFFNQTNLSVNDRKQLPETCSSAEIVKQAVESNNPTRTEERWFIAAVVSSGTRSDIVDHVSGTASVPPIITGPVAMLLRYTDAMGTPHEFNGTGYFPGSFVFGAVRIMITAAVEHMELFLDLNDRFEEVHRFLRRLDGYLNALHTADTATPSLIPVLIDIVRFCGQVTKYIKGILLGLWILKKFVRAIPDPKERLGRCYTSTQPRHTGVFNGRSQQYKVGDYLWKFR